MDESPQACACGERSNLQRLPPIFRRTKKHHVEKKVGDATNKHIEESRRALKEQKGEAAQKEMK